MVVAETTSTVAGQEPDDELDRAGASEERPEEVRGVERERGADSGQVLRAGEVSEDDVRAETAH